MKGRNRCGTTTLKNLRVSLSALSRVVRQLLERSASSADHRPTSLGKAGDIQEKTTSKTRKMHDDERTTTWEARKRS